MKFLDFHTPWWMSESSYKILSYRDAWKLPYSRSPGLYWFLCCFLLTFRCLIFFNTNSSMFSTVIYFFISTISPLSLSVTALFVSPSSQVKHSLNAGLVAVEIVLSAIPYRMVHFIYPVLGGVIYSLFNLVYWLLNGPSPLGTATIYPEINWARPGRTMGIICVILFLILVMHCLLFALQMLRRFLASLIYGPPENDESEAILKPSDSGYSAINSAPLPPTRP